MASKETRFEDALVGKIIKHAEIVAHQATFSHPDDYDDLMQEIRMNISKALGKIDTTRKTSPRAYLKKVVRNVTARFIQRRYAIERKFGVPLSLEAPVSGNDGGEDAVRLRDVISDGRDTTIEDVLEAEFAERLRTLPADDRKICEMVLDGDSFTVIARKTGVSRATFYRNILPRLKTRLASLLDLR